MGHDETVCPPGIEQFEKGSNPNALSGEDWFRLGRLHDLLVEPSEAEAAYRRSVSAFTKEKSGSAIYRSLALAKVANTMCTWCGTARRRRSSIRP